MSDQAVLFPKQFPHGRIVVQIFWLFFRNFWAIFWQFFWEFFSNFLDQLVVNFLDNFGTYSWVTFLQIPLRTPDRGGRGSAGAVPPFTSPEYAPS